MEENKLMVTDSRFFSREFNTAIIDGPLRIYFADRQESEALKLYFDIQEILAEKGMRLETLSLDKTNMFLMLYPTKQTFKDAFQRDDDEIAYGEFGDHLVLGVNGPYNEDTRKRIGQHVEGLFVEGIKFHGATFR
jgi:ATP-dependent DNA ligase